LAIIGDPVSHSFSPLLHNSTIAALKLDPAVYTRLHLIEGDRLKTAFFSHGLYGANVTVPHKEAAFNACDRLCPLAEQIGAVNTLVLEEGLLCGYNTDAPGFMEAIKHFGRPKRVLILGAGGTARAIAAIMGRQGYDCTVLNRSANRLTAFKGFEVACATWAEPPQGPFEMVINTTSAGLKDESLPLESAFLDHYFASARVAIEVIYGKETPFLSRARKAGLQTQDGLAMLIEQAALAFKHFFSDQDPARVSTLMHQSAIRFGL
jgi:shikimate dehydrogenase